MTDAAIIKADFADTRRVKGRAVLQIILETDLVNEKSVMEALGWPTPGNGLPCAVARLNNNTPQGADGPQTPIPGVNPSNASPNADKARTPFRELPRSQQAALKCKDAEFQVWLAKKYKTAWDEFYYTQDCTSESAANNTLRAALAIKSKTELDSDQTAAKRYDALMTDFDYRNMDR